MLIPFSIPAIDGEVDRYEVKLLTHAVTHQRPACLYHLTSNSDSYIPRFDIDIDLYLFATGKVRSRPSPSQKNGVSTANPALLVERAKHFTSI